MGAGTKASDHFVKVFSTSVRAQIPHPHCRVPSRGQNAFCLAISSLSAEKRYRVVRHKHPVPLSLEIPVAVSKLDICTNAAGRQAVGICLPRKEIRPLPVQIWTPC